MSVGAPKIAMFCFGTHMRYRFDLLLKNYQYKAAQDFTYLKNYGLAMIHKTRPEDTFYSCGYREVWAHFSFDYSDVTSISKFIQNNKQQLRNYYAQHLPVEDITDTHVYTYLGS